MIERLRSRAADLKDWADRRRLPILAIAAVAFCVGILLSVRELGVGPGDIRSGPLILLCLFGVPVSILLNAAEFQLCARATGRSAGLTASIRITSTAAVANLLPLPAGFAIRGSALLAAGAGLRQAGTILFAAGLMWLAMASAMTGAALAHQAPIGWAVSAAGAVSAIALVWWVARTSSLAVALGFAAVRAGLLAVLTIRLALSFAVIGAAMPLTGAAAYAVAGVAGTVVTFVPAGLGVSEGVGALIAEVAGASPSAAFLALGLNRIVGLLGCAAAAAALWALREPPASARGTVEAGL